jgi:N-methylhydantoinase A
MSGRQRVLRPVFFGDIHGVKNLITIDMGGTSLDACLVRNREPEITTENQVNHFAMAAPSVAVHSIGAGGGSIAYIDRSGMFRVGPQSAGALPGPVCYNMEGKDPTVTDADLVCGYLNPDYFLGGKLKLHPDLASRAIQEKIADKLGMSLHEAAFGIYKIINTNMVEGSESPVFKGYDPRSCFWLLPEVLGLSMPAISQRSWNAHYSVPKALGLLCPGSLFRHPARLCPVTHMVMPDRVDLGAIDSRNLEMKEEATAASTRKGSSGKEAVCPLG